MAYSAEKEGSFKERCGDAYSNIYANFVQLGILLGGDGYLGYMLVLHSLHEGLAANHCIRIHADI